MKSKRLVLVGGGLSGMSLAYFLSKENLNIQMVEASSRLGGRIHTAIGKLGTPLELGATWFSDGHQNLLQLLTELGLEKYLQFSGGKSLFQSKSNVPAQSFYVAESENPSYRIVGGTERLIEKLRENISNVGMLFETRISAIIDNGNEITLKTSDGDLIYADLVILCLPPQLVGSQIQFSPNLPEDIINILPTVQTWMGGSIKFTLEYNKPFWRNNGYSGMLYTQEGIVIEMYDHTNFEGNKFGFTGFLNPAAAVLTKQEREKQVLHQLFQLFGEDIFHPSTYVDRVWTGADVFIKTQFMHRPHQNNGHNLLKKSYMNGKLYFSGTETATNHAGYMEGAIISAQEMSRICIQGNQG